MDGFQIGHQGYGLAGKPDLFVGDMERFHMVEGDAGVPMSDRVVTLSHKVLTKDQSRWVALAPTLGRR